MCIRDRELTQGLNDRILDLASTLAASCDAALHVLNVNNWSVMGDATRSVPTSSLDDSLRDAVNDAQEEAFEVLVERYGIEKKCQHLLTGIPHKVIGFFAQQNAFDMVVLGYGLSPRNRQVDRQYCRERAEQRPMQLDDCLLYTSPSPRDATLSRMPSSA